MSSDTRVDSEMKFCRVRSLLMAAGAGVTMLPAVFLFLNKDLRRCLTSFDSNSSCLLIKRTLTQYKAGNNENIVLVCLHGPQLPIH
jgi:hypothetical protein